MKWSWKPAHVAGIGVYMHATFLVWIGAAQEASMVQMEAALAGIPVRRAMITEFRTLSPRDVLDRAVGLLVTGAQKDFPVVDDGRVVGLLLHSDLPGALARRGKNVPVVDVMRRDFQTVDSHEMLEVAFRRLQACECHAVPVLHGGRLDTRKESWCCSRRRRSSSGSPAVTPRSYPGTQWD